MFDGGVPEGLLAGGALACADDASVVAAIAGWARVEAGASARRLAAIAELVGRRADGPTDSARWSCDNWDAMAAEVGAAQGISHGMASGQMYLAVALRDRLARVAALFVDGVIGARLVSRIVWHTYLIKDPEVLGLVDAMLACEAAGFGSLSDNKTAQAIDAIVDRYDPAALRHTRAGARGRDVVIDSGDQRSGAAALWGSLFATDAAVLDRRLGVMAHQVCDEDPRTIAQRRADALGALGAGSQRLACGCGNDACGAGVGESPTAVVVHVVTEASALDARPDPHLSGEEASRPVTPEMTLAEALAPDPEPAGSFVCGAAPAAVLTSGGIIPNSVLATLIHGGAKIRPVDHPGDLSAPEAGYRPSAALERFIRCRDLTCRFPNCDRPAEFCDVDHAVAFPLGPTHASNLRCLCRKHHLLKTFWTGWRDRQLPDATIIWTSPTGQTYTTRPGSRLLFPSLCRPTGELLTAPTVFQPRPERELMMPKRRRTRAQDRARRIDAERALNAAHVAERNQPPPF